MTTHGGTDRRWKALWVCLFASSMTLLDVSIVNVALPAMQHGIGAAPSDLSWVVAGYALTFGLALVPGGRLGDDHGRKRMFLVGLALFAITSAVCGVAQDPTGLVVARLCQGFAGGLLTPQVAGMIQQLFTGRERGRAFGLFGAMIGVSTTLGPLAGGLLIEAFGSVDGWRSVFFVNLPVGAVVMVLAVRLLPADARRAGGGRLDLVGSALLGLGVTAVMLPLMQAADRVGKPQWWLFGAGLVPLVLFVLWERRLAAGGGRPLVRLELFAVRGYRSGALLGMLYSAGFTGVFPIVTLFFQQGLGYSPFQAGASTMAFAVGSAISPPLGGRLVHRLGRRLVAIGVGTVAVGFAGTAVLVHQWTGPLAGFVLAGPLLVAGIGSGLVLAPNQTLTLAEVPVAEGGTAAGVLQTAQRIGGALGTVVTSSLLFSSLSGAHDFHSAAALGLLGATGLVVLALAVSVTDVLVSRHQAAKPQVHEARG